MAATTILRTRTRFRPPKIRLQCRLFNRLNMEEEEEEEEEYFIYPRLSHQAYL